MALHQLGRNICSKATAGFGPSFFRGHGGAAGVTAPVAAPPSAAAARRFCSGSLSSIKREFQDLRAEFNDLSWKEYATLTFGTAYLVLGLNHFIWTLPADISRIKNFTKSKFSGMRGDAERSKDPRDLTISSGTCRVQWMHSGTKISLRNIKDYGNP